MKRVALFLFWVLVSLLAIGLFVLDQASREVVREKVRSVMRGGAR
jgi:hypothetical protein